MQIDNNILTNSEILSFGLRKLFCDAGFERYAMTKFEEYKLYANHLDYLDSDRILTFTDTDGKLMALKPDITLSIVKNFKAKPKNIQKLYYNENVYRVSSGTGKFKEIPQAGVECIGDFDKVSSKEIISLASKSLQEISDETVLCTSHLGILDKVVGNPGRAVYNEILDKVRAKKTFEIDAKSDSLIKLMNLYGKFSDVKDTLYEICKEVNALPEYEDFKEAVSDVDPFVDFSLFPNTEYYNGLVFAGYVKGIPESVLSGGRYDKLLKKLGISAGAIGFAMYLDRVERVS